MAAPRAVRRLHGEAHGFPQAFFAGWTDEQLAGVRCPVLLVQGDRDFTTVEHGALMQRLIPGAQLAVLPGTTHMSVTRQPDVLLPLLRRFFGDA